jgi:hypothetical protein
MKSVSCQWTASSDASQGDPAGYSFAGTDDDDWLSSSSPDDEMATGHR